MSDYVSKKAVKGAIGRVCYGLVLDEETEKALKDEIDKIPSKKVVSCKYCLHSIKKDYVGVKSYEYLCVLKSTVTHLEEHEGDYFCKDGDRK